MSQPPHPPQGGNPPGDDHPTEEFGWPPPEERPREQTREFGPPLSGQPPYGPPSYGPPPYGNPGYGPPSYGPPQYGPPSYGPPQYGPPQYGQPPYGTPPYGRPPQGRTGLVIALVIGGIVLLAGLGVALALVVGRGGTGVATAVSGSATPSGGASSPGQQGTGSDPGSPSAGSSIPPATVPPDGLGDDPLYDALAQDCYEGVMESCDALYAATKDDDSLATYSDYADTCAGRQEGGTSEYCTDAFPGD